MSYKAQYTAYGVASETVSKTRQVVMLYDGIINFVKKAKDAILEDRIEDRFNLVQRACAIVLGLQASLDFEQGGKVAHILNKFYSSVDLRLMNLHQSNNAADCDVIVEDLKKMRDAWEDVNNNHGDTAIAIPSQESLSSKLESIAVNI